MSWPTQRKLVIGSRPYLGSVSRDIHGVAVRLKPHDALVIVSALYGIDAASLCSLASLRARLKETVVA